MSHPPFSCDMADNRSGSNEERSSGAQSSTSSSVVPVEAQGSVPATRVSSFAQNRNQITVTSNADKSIAAPTEVKDLSSVPNAGGGGGDSIKDKEPEGRPECEDSVRYKGDIVCDDCQAKFETTRDFANHIRRQHHEPRNHVACNVKGCRAHFLTTDELITHRLQHEGSTNRIPCFACESSFPTHEDHHKHVLKIHGDPACGSVCPFKNCNGLFPVREDLARHIQETHTESKGTITCDFFQDCNQNLPSADAFVQHLRKSHFGFNAIHCNFPKCGAHFRESTTLHEHIMEYHAGFKKITCDSDKCGAQFDDSKTLCEHIKALHVVTPVTPPQFKCPHEDCCALFETNEQFLRHLDKYHK